MYDLNTQPIPLPKTKKSFYPKPTLSSRPRKLGDSNN